MIEKNSVHLAIDSSSLVYAAFYTTGLLAEDGKPTGVVFGFLNKLLKLAKDFNTRHVYFCWDHPVNFRKNVYPLYKYNRVDNMSPSDVLDKSDRDAQAKELREISLPAMGFTNHFQQRGYEGDDMLAALAKLLNGRKLLMVTSDTDMYQSLEICDIVNPVTGNIMTQQKFEKKYGVNPSQWPICKAIGGCTGDNVIGIKGAADPSKAKDKNCYTLRYVRGELSTGVIYERIRSKEGQNIIKKNLPIVTCPYKPENMKPLIRRRDKCTRKKFIEVFSKYNFRSQLAKGRFSQWETAFLK